MGENINTDTTQISSVDILRKSGFSRATLNNYIKMGILPHPLIKKPDHDSVSKARRLGYFPYSVLNTLNQIIQYKKQGRQLGEIRILLTGKSIQSPDDVPSTPPATHAARPDERSPGYGNESEELFPLNGTQTGTLPANQWIERQSRIRFEQGPPNLVLFSVLAARLQNAAKISAELPSEHYISLIRRLWESTVLLSKTYSGIHKKLIGNGMVVYFIRDRDSSYLMNTILCALELRETMKEISHEWKMRGAPDSLYLNIGINEGQESMGTIADAPAEEIVFLGDAVHSARLLAALARSGSVLTTKNLVNRLDEKDRKRIRYGIYRREANRDILIENVFSRVMDMVGQDNPRHIKYMRIGTLPVTEIRNLR